MMKENYDRNGSSSSNCISLKCFTFNENKSSIESPQPSSRFYRKKFKIQSSSKILSCKQINQQFSQLVVTNRNTISGLKHAISEMETKKQKKEKTFARKFNLLSRKIKKEDEKTQELMAQIMMLKKQVYQIQKTMADLMPQQPNPSSIQKKQNEKKSERRNSKRSVSKTPLKFRRNNMKKNLRPNRLYGVY